MTEDVSDGDRIGSYKPTTTDETAVDKGRAELVLPSSENVIIFLIMHLSEIAHEERRRGRTIQDVERRESLAN